MKSKSVRDIPLRAIQDGVAWNDNLLLANRASHKVSM
jgi:hypothetical protein